MACVQRRSLGMWRHEDSATQPGEGGAASSSPEAQGGAMEVDR